MIEVVTPQRAPALVGLWSKARWAPSDEQRAVEAAMLAARGAPTPLPVVHGPHGQVIGVVRARGYADPRVDYYPMRDRLPLERWVRRYDFGFANYDAIINAITAGRRGSMSFSKGATTAPVALNWYDLWPVAGLPGAGTYTGSAATARSLTDSATGALYKFGNVEGTYSMHLVAAWAAYSAGATGQVLMLYDRVLTYEALLTTTTTAQSLTNSVSAARYNGAGLSGMQLVLTAQTALGATACSITALTYTDQDGNASQAMPTTRAPFVIVSAAAPTGSLGARVVSPIDTGGTTPWSWCLPLAAGDGGVRSVQNYQLGAVQSGTLCLVLARPLVYVPLPTAAQASQMDLVQQLTNLERVYDGACLSFLSFFSAATGATIQGAFDTSWN